MNNCSIACKQSVVLVSKLPLIALFQYVTSVMAPEYFRSGEPSLEAGFLLFSLDAYKYLYLYLYLFIFPRVYCCLSIPS